MPATASRTDDREASSVNLRPLAVRLALLAAAILILATVNPPTLPLCGFRWLTGRPCPLCGLTHAFFALAKGHWSEALHWHALSPLAALMLAALLWNPPRLSRLWTPCAAAFALYGLTRLLL